MCQVLWCALHTLLFHVIFTSTLWVPSYYWCGNWGPERVSNLPHVSQAGSGRARIPNQVFLIPNPFVFTSQPLHNTSTVGRPGWTAICKQLAKAAFQQIQETIQSVKRKGKAILKEKLFFFPSWLRGSSLPQAAEGKEGAECSLNVHSPNCFSMTLSSHSRENAGPELKCRPKPFSQGFQRSFVGENFLLSWLSPGWKLPDKI